MQRELKTEVENMLSRFEKETPLSEGEFEAVTKSFDFTIPETYLNVMKVSNGGEGEIGDESWLVLFPINELQQVNDNYRLLMTDIPDYFLIGKDAADTGYAFHKTYGTFHSFGLMSNFKTDSIEFLGKDFVAFLEYLYNYRYKE